MTNVLFLLTVINLADYSSATPDTLHHIHAYDTLEECWTAAETLSYASDLGESVIVCLAE